MAQSRRVAAWFVACTFTFSVPGWSANLFQHDDFQDGTTGGWGGAADPTNIPSGGPDGVDDAYLQITGNGTIGPGSRVATRNQSPEWAGDYLAVGAQRISVDLLNPNAVPLEMRVALIGPVDIDLRWTSTDANVVPADGVWRTYEFFLFESELTQVMGEVSYDDLMQDVLQVVLRHDEGDASATGTPIAAMLGLDNIRLLPGGDFDVDGNVDIDDVDALVAAIAGGGNPTGFDLTGDAVVNDVDLNEWLRLAGYLDLGRDRAYLEGDANLDGFVDGLDFIAWNGNKFTQSASWSGGDFNADGFIDGLDFIVWNGNKFMSADGTVAVPEPAGGCGLWIMLCLAIRRRPGNRTICTSK